MPWMIYFQQSAVVARRLQTSKAMSEERTGTLLGSVLTQLIMIGALVTLAAAHSINKDDVGAKGCKVKDVEKAWGIPLMVIGSIWLDGFIENWQLMATSCWLLFNYCILLFCNVVEKGAVANLSRGYPQSD